MTTEEFFMTVYNMREHQRAYFKTHSADDLKNSKKAEALVDRLIREHFSRQINLFNDKPDFEFASEAEEYYMREHHDNKAY